MNQSTPNPLVSFEGFAATAALIERLEAKAAKLRRHHATPLGGLHLHLKLETPHTGPVRFHGTAVVRSGPRDLALRADNVEPGALINDLFSKLERALHDHAGERKHARHSTDASASA